MSQKKHKVQKNDVSQFHLVGTQLRDGTILLRGGRRITEFPATVELLEGTYILTGMPLVDSMDENGKQSIRAVYYSLSHAYHTPITDLLEASTFDDASDQE